MMNVRETDRMPQPYTPTPNGFERRLRAWVGLPTADVSTPDPTETSAPPTEPGVSASARSERRSET
jgi:hypothetical protein